MEAGYLTSCMLFSVVNFVSAAVQLRNPARQLFFIIVHVNL